MNSHSDALPSAQGLRPTQQPGTPFAGLFRPRGQKNMRVTLNLPAPLLDRLRNTVYWTPGLTLTELIKGALQQAIDGFEERQGHPFPSRLSELKSGRPRKRPSVPALRDTYEPHRVARMPERSGSTGLMASVAK